MKPLLSKLFSVIFILSLFISVTPIKAQQLWSFTYGGGINGWGEVFSMPTGGNTVTHYDMPGIGAAGPQRADLIQLPNGDLYGTTGGGGCDGSGVIFKCDSNLQNFKIVYGFHRAIGRQPMGPLMLASNGLLYGLTSTGGANNLGVIFSFNPNTLTYTDVYDFVNNRGATPWGSLIQLANHKLYGFTTAGGTSGYGVIFSFDPNTHAYTDLLNFNGTTQGGSPFGTPMQATNGKLYGTAETGGSNYDGVLFSFDTGTHAFTVLFNFDNTHGRSPQSSPIQASNGLLYGTANGGALVGSMIYSYNITTSTYTDIFDCNNSTTGSDPGSLIQLPNGNLYGLSASGGTFNNGILFSFNPVNSTYTNLRSLQNSDGSAPLGELLYGSTGRLYGFVSNGAAGRAGALHEFDLSGNLLNSIIFNTDYAGTYPNGVPLYASNGLMYGLAYAGGKYGKGTIFSFDPNSGIFNDVHDFNDTLGGEPNGSLMQASNGLIYGTTPQGGSNLWGTIFSFDPNTNNYSVVYNFNGTLGEDPESGGLMQASNGLLYGTAYRGGSNSSGVVYSYDINTNTYTDCYNFPAPDGNPSCFLMQASDGWLYGTATNWLNNINYYYGYVFRMNPNNNNFSIIYTFPGGLTGIAPEGAMFQAGNGRLYGLTERGGIYGWANGEEADGTFFTLDSLGNNFKDIRYFNDTLGGFPEGEVMQASNGKLYGFTYSGGTGNLPYTPVGYGIIFEYDTASQTFTTKFNFNEDDGLGPNGAFIETPTYLTSAKNITTTKAEAKIYPNPNNGTFNLSIKTNELGIKYAIEIYNTLGEKIYSEIFSSLHSQFTINGPSGVYFYRVTSEKGEQIGTGKLVIEK